MARWGSFLDQVIDIEMAHFDASTGQVWDPIEAVILPRPETEQVGPLVWYDEGTRFEIGVAKVNQRTGTVVASVSEHLTQGLGIRSLIEHGGPYSIVASVDMLHELPEYRVKPEPVFPRVSLDKFTMPPEVPGPYESNYPWGKV